MVVPERSRKGTGARRLYTFVVGFLLGAILTCTITMWHLSLKTTGTTKASSKLESESSSATLSSSASATRQKQKGQVVTTTATTMSTGGAGGGGRLPSRDYWVQQSQKAAQMKQQQSGINTSPTTTTTTKTEKSRPMPIALAKQLAAIHERRQINTKPENTQQQQQAVPVKEHDKTGVRYDQSAHDMVDMEIDKIHRDSRIGDMFQALGNAGNSDSNKGAAPAMPVVAKTTTMQLQRNAQLSIVAQQQHQDVDKTSQEKKDEMDSIQKAIEHVLIPVKQQEENAEGMKQQDETVNNDKSKDIYTAETRDADNTKMEKNTKTTTSDVTKKPDEVQDFVKQPGVVIAVKIHGSGHVIQLKQSLCLLKAAYNDRLNYDIMVFVTEALSDNEVRDLKEVVHPAHLIIETDKQTLSKQLAALTREQKQDLLARCEKNSTDELFWWTRCCDEGNRGDCMPLAYNWQAEFRSKWIWYSKGLANYKWMMWYDSDAMATKVWQQDPVAFAIRNELKMLFDHFPQGWRSSEELRGMMEDAYNGDHICDVRLVNGQLEAFRKVGGCTKPKIPQIHGFFHITDLDFYRSEANLKWFNNMIGNHKFTRTWDDQLAVTVPAAVLAANKSWDMNSNGIILDVYHNQHFDGDTKRRHRGGGYVHWWENYSNTSFPEAIEECAQFVKNSG